MADPEIPWPLGVGAIVLGLLFIYFNGRIGRHSLPASYRRLAGPLGMEADDQGRFWGLIALGAGWVFIGVVALIVAVLG